MTTKINNLLNLYNALDAEYSFVREPFITLARNFLPRRYRSVDLGKPQQTDNALMSSLLSGKSIRAARTLAAGMLAGATSPAKPWVRFKVKPETVLAQRWADDVSKIINDIISHSNLHNVLASCYLDVGVFGTSPIIVYADKESVIRAYSFPAGEYRLAQDSSKRINTLARKLTMTSFQIKDQFGAKERGDKAGQKEHTVYHVIKPNEGEMPKHFAYIEYYWKQNKMLVENGYYEKPFAVARWEVIGNDVYAVSPGMDALPDVLQLQQMIRNRGEALDKMTNPPVILDNSLRSQPAPLMPGAITYASNVGEIPARPVYTIDPPLAGLVQTEETLKLDIDEAFYVDLWKAILNLRTVRSATEIAERSEEKLVLLGPVVGRLEDELLDPLVFRILNIAMRSELIPLPDETLGEVYLEYDSILSEAQRAIGINSMERFVSSVGSMAGLVPGSIQVIDWDELIRNYGDKLSVPASIMRPRKEVNAIRQSEAELAAAREQAVIGQQLTQGAKNLADARR